jgi:hypothetical protein
MPQVGILFPASSFVYRLTHKRHGNARPFVTPSDYFFRTLVTTNTIMIARMTIRIIAV